MTIEHHSFGAYEDEPDFVEETKIPSDPHGKIGFELDIQDDWYSFAPTYYPDTIRIKKGRETERDGRQCGGENVTVDEIKNREVHISGQILATEVPLFNRIMDHKGKLDFISPKTPSSGLECEIDEIELGDLKGWDPVEKVWKFKYSIDLISTGRDEYDDGGDNEIVSKILEPTDEFELEGLLTGE